jgi:hypothetical protein
MYAFFNNYFHIAIDPFVDDPSCHENPEILTRLTVRISERDDLLSIVTSFLTIGQSFDFQIMLLKEQMASHEFQMTDFKC